MGYVSIICALIAVGGRVMAKNDYEYIVIGAGSAGSIVASELAQSGGSVLLLEAGGDDSDPAIWSMSSYYNVAFNTYNYGFLHWHYQTTNQTFNGKGVGTIFDLPRGKVCGGSNSINGAAYVMGNPADFDSVADGTGDEDWSWESMAGDRKRLNDAFQPVELGKDQVGADEYIKTAKDVLGFEFNPDCNNGYQAGICPSVWTGSISDNGGTRKTSFDTFARPATNNECTSKMAGELDIVTFHMVNSLIFDSVETNKVIGVATMNLRSNIPANFTATKEVIISAGTYNSPKILLLSGIGPEKDLAKLGIEVRVPLNGVGKNLRNHYSVPTYWTRENLIQDEPFLFQSPTFNMFGPEKKGPPTYQFEISGTYGSVIPLRLESVGEVTLASSDAAVAPLINPNILSSEADVQTMVTGLSDYILPYFKSLTDQGLVSPANIQPDASKEEITDFVLQSISTNHHPVGTCKVGDMSDDLAVVDSSLKVFGTIGLRVIDASVFPLAPSGNINLPTMTVAMMGAHKILPVRKGKKSSKKKGKKSKKKRSHLDL